MNGLAEPDGDQEYDYEPVIVAFCCNWCSYAGADLAGVSRFQYPSNVRIIRIMCTGRLEPNFILRALERGVDGVLVAGCHIGDCHYISGNERAEPRVKMVRKVARMVGFDPRRIRLEWISASEGQKFADTITEFTTLLKRLGPNPLTLVDPAENDQNEGEHHTAKVRVEA